MAPIDAACHKESNTGLRSAGTSLNQKLSTIPARSSPCVLLQHNPPTGVNPVHLSFWLAVASRVVCSGVFRWYRWVLVGTGGGTGHSWHLLLAILAHKARCLLTPHPFEFYCPLLVHCACIVFLYITPCTLNPHNGGRWQAQNKVARFPIPRAQLKDTGLGFLIPL